MMVSSDGIFLYLFNGFLHVDNFVVELFFPAKMLELSPGRWCVGGPVQKLPPKKFFFGGRHNFLELLKHPKKQTDDEQREANFSPR
jgi:hypothetical protein